MWLRMKTHLELLSERSATTRTEMLAASQSNSLFAGNARGLAGNSRSANEWDSRVSSTLYNGDLENMIKKRVTTTTEDEEFLSDKERTRRVGTYSDP